MPHGRALSFAAKRQECCVSNITPPQAEKFFCPTFCTLQKVGKRSRRKAAKGFNFVSAWSLFGCAESRFAKPRKFPKGRRVYSFCVVQKEPKSTPEACEPLDSGDDSKLCRKYCWRRFRRHESKPVFRAKRRRKGFESVRGSSVTA